ncbi:MAG: hypothetical protein AAF554_17115 [Bacteroidota bacterium]
MKKIKIKQYLFLLPLLVVGCAKAQNGPEASHPQSDVVIAEDQKYYDRHKIDISNLRDYYNGLLIADLMIHAKGMFEAETKWKFTLYQMIKAKSNHHIARSAYQLSLMGVPTEEILSIWSDDYVNNVKDPRIQAAFKYLDVASKVPTKVTADTHAMLRMHFVDRQICELTELTSINAANVVHDQILPIVTDQETLDWANQNLRSVGWSPGLNAGTAEEQHANPFVGETLEKAYDEINKEWNRGDLSAKDPEFKTDWVNFLTGYNVSPVTFDGDLDGIEDPFDAYPIDYLSWKSEEMNKANIPDASSSKLDIAEHNWKYFSPAVVKETQYPFSERQMLDLEFTRESSLGTLMMDSYMLTKDRALSLKMKWSLFFVFQLASGCTHCQVHGSFGVFQEFEKDYVQDEIPVEALPEVIAYIHDLMDFENSNKFSEAEKAAFRLARDSGPTPGLTTATHIEDLRRYYTDREIQEIIANCVLTGWLATTITSQASVTDRKSMSWALKHLTPKGWNPGVHIGRPNEQRPYHMSELFAAAFAQIASGDVPDVSSDWVGEAIPLAIDSDADGVYDAYDGFPNDPSRWEDTDRDGVEDSKDDDIDGDGISNREEITKGTFPYKADSDGDGIDDAAELKNGTNPVDPRFF